MAKVACFIDGFNLYHAIDSSFNHHKYKWLNLRLLAEQFIQKEERLTSVTYFTAYCAWDESKYARHKTYVRALSAKGVDVVLGQFQEVRKKFINGKMEVENVVPPDATLPNSFNFFTYEEKKTDVNIAVKLIELAAQGSFDKFYIISADSDFVPALKYIRRFHRSIGLVNVVPVGAKARKLGQVCDHQIEMLEDHLSSSLLEGKIMQGADCIERPEKYA